MSLGVLKRDRILVLGAGGWLGRTFLDLIPEGPDVLAIASTRRGIFQEWCDEGVRDFRPTIVANFAFLTPDRVAKEGADQFRETNRLLLTRFALAADLPTVRSVLTVSSGAALLDPTSPYGEQKIQEESIALGLVGASRSVVVARAYSVSGGYVRRPSDYAMSDMILQAQTGLVRIISNRLIYRRYVSATDLLSVCASHAISGWSGIIESGGDLLEMQELASTIVSVINPRAEIQRPPLSDSPEEVYASDNVSWLAACHRLSYQALNIEEQVSEAHRVLQRSRQETIN